MLAAVDAVMSWVIVVAAVALVAGLAADYLLGRLRRWDRLGNWAADQVQFTGRGSGVGAAARLSSSWSTQ
ncbi:hypothetical protein [Streptomyces umbrinus]|uniref:hypothetical protein n=1 Tax=Streptomyces umbrinus TaxID=67370 RepID=UPI003424E986